MSAFRRLHLDGSLQRRLPRCFTDQFAARKLNQVPQPILNCRKTALFSGTGTRFYQIASVAHHSLGAINGIKAGVFRPPGQLSPATYADMQKTLADTITALQAITPAEVNALEGKDVSFELGAFKMPFVAENFILSFSLPNFYFHATTTYDILRTHGVTLGKRDFMGPLRLKA